MKTPLKPPNKILLPEKTTLLPNKIPQSAGEASFNTYTLCLTVHLTEQSSAEGEASLPVSRDPDLVIAYAIFVVLSSLFANLNPLA